MDEAHDDFFGKEAYIEQRERAHQPAYLRTFTMQDNVDSNGFARNPVGSWPIVEPETGDVLIDEVGRRSYITSIAYGPSSGKNIALGYLPKVYAEGGRILTMEYFCEHYPFKVEAVGYRALYDPDNERMKS